MSLIQGQPHQKNYNIIEYGWLTNTVRSVSKEEFLTHQRESESALSINKFIKTVAIGILGTFQVARTAAPISRSGMEIALPAFTSYFWSHIPMACAQTTMTVAPIPTPAPGPQGDEFQANSYTTNDQQSPSIVALSGGGFVVTWQSLNQDGCGANCGGIYGQIYGTSGMRMGSEFQINTFIGDQVASSMAALSGGGFVVAWESFGQDGSNNIGIYGQMYTASGVKVGTEFQINTFIGTQTDPSVAALSGGGFVVAWSSDQQNGSNSYGIYGQMYDASGVKMGSEFQINTYMMYLKENPCVAALTGGAFVVAWESLGQDGPGKGGIYGQMYSATGVKMGGEFQINTFIGTQQFPSVAALSGGGFVVTWESYAQDGTYHEGIYGQMYDASGAKMGSEFQINTYIGDQTCPNVAALLEGGFIATWDSIGQDGQPNYGIYGQIYDASGAKVGTEFHINNYIGYQQCPRAASISGRGGFVVTWQSQNQDGSGWGIYGRLFPGNSTSTTQLVATSSFNTGVLNSSTGFSMSKNQKTSGVDTTLTVPSGVSSIVPNTRFIAGLAGLGALICSLVAGAVVFLRQRAKKRNNNLEKKSPVLSPIKDIDSRSPYGEVPMGFGQVDQNGYHSARFNLEKGHYQDPLNWQKELEENPPLKNYTNINDVSAYSPALPAPPPGTNPYASNPEQWVKLSDL